MAHIISVYYVHKFARRALPAGGNSRDFLEPAHSTLAALIVNQYLIRMKCDFC
jgi:hypothetical protein